MNAEHRATIEAALRHYGKYRAEFGRSVNEQLDLDAKHRVAIDDALAALAQMDIDAAECEGLAQENDMLFTRAAKRLAHIKELEARIAELERMVSLEMEQALEQGRSGILTEQAWQPVDPIGMANDEYADAEIKLCYRRVKATVDDNWMFAHAPEPEPDPPEPPDDWDEGNDDDKPHYDTPGGW